MNNLRLALFNRGTPLTSQLSINPITLAVDDTSGTAIFVNLFMSQDVTEVGCFAKVCDDHEYGIVKPITNYRKVKYSCALEADAKFECSDDLINNFQSDSYTLRDFTKAIIVDRKAVFYNFCPYNYNMFIDPNGQTSTASQKVQTYIRLMLSPEVTEIGCFHKLCGSYEFMACKTGHTVIAPDGSPLYKPGNRCLADADCTLPGYGICDIESGLCEVS
uniref:Leishmanolysin n=1 Tax=Panagrellus redivivus TaxID=6233 RepID=A0A7E4WBJ0_PANRE